MRKSSQRKKQLRRRRGESGPRAGYLGVNRVPSFTPTLHVNHTFRWVVVSGSSASVQGSNMFNWYLMATSSTTTGQIFGAMRIKAIRAWSAIPATATQSTTVAVEWLGDNVSSQVTSDQSAGFNPGYVSVKPPKNSSCGWWQTLDGSNVSDNIFQFTHSVGAVLEVDVEGFLIDVETAHSGTTTTGATAGRIYGGGLVGNAANIAPVGLTALP